MTTTNKPSDRNRADKPSALDRIRAARISIEKTEAEMAKERRESEERALARIRAVAHRIYTNRG